MFCKHRKGRKTNNLEEIENNISEVGGSPLNIRFVFQALGPFSSFALSIMSVTLLITNEKKTNYFETSLNN